MKLLNLSKSLQLVHNGGIFALQYGDCVEVIDCKIVMNSLRIDHFTDVIVRGTNVYTNEPIKKEAERFVRDGTLYISGIFYFQSQGMTPPEYSDVVDDRCALEKILPYEEFANVITKLRQYTDDEQIDELLWNAVLNDDDLDTLFAERTNFDELRRNWDSRLKDGYAYTVKSLSDEIFGCISALIEVTQLGDSDLYFDPLLVLEKLEFESNMYIVLSSDLILHKEYGIMNRYMFVKLIARRESGGNQEIAQEYLNAYDHDIISTAAVKTEFADEMSSLTRTMLITLGRMFVEQEIIRIHLNDGLISLAYTEKDFVVIVKRCTDAIFKTFQQENYKHSIVHYASHKTNPLSCKRFMEEEYEKEYNKALLRVRLNCKSRIQQKKCTATSLKDSIALGQNHAYDATHKVGHHRITLFILLYVCAFLLLSTLESFVHIDNVLTITSIVPLILHFYQIDFGFSVTDWVLAWDDVKEDWNWMFVIFLYVTFICIKTVDLSDPLYMMVMNPVTAVFNALTLLFIDQLRKSIYCKVFLVLQILFFTKSYMEVYFLDVEDKELLISIANVSFSSILMNLIRKLNFFSKPVIRLDDTICVYSTKPVSFMRSVFKQ